MILVKRKQFFFPFTLLRPNLILIRRDSYTLHHKHPNLEGNYQAEKGHLTRNMDFKFLCLIKFMFLVYVLDFVGVYLTRSTSDR